MPLRVYLGMRPVERKVSRRWRRRDERDGGVLLGIALPDLGVWAFWGR